MSDTEEKEKKVYDHLFKILLAGDERVGKSSIIKQYVDYKFRADYVKTPAVDFAVKNLPLERQRIKLHILDIPGDTETTQPEKEKSHYQNVHGVVIVFDLTNEKSFHNVKLYHDKVKSWNPEAFVFLMGSKADLNEDRVIKREDALVAASKFGAEYFEVHAKDNAALSETFNRVCTTLLKSKDSGRRDRAWWKKKQQTI